MSRRIWYICFRFSFSQYLRHRALMYSQIDLCGLNRFVPQKGSYIYEWYPSFKHMNRFAVSETVRGITFFLKVFRMITFCRGHIFADKVLDTRRCYPVRFLAWKEVLIPIVLQGFPPFCQISSYQFHNIRGNGDFPCFVSFPMYPDSGGLGKSHITDQNVTYFLCPCTEIIKQCQQCNIPAAGFTFRCRSA